MPPCMKAGDADRLFVAQFSHFHIMRSDRTIVVLFNFAGNVTEMSVLAAIIFKLMERSAVAPISHPRKFQETRKSKRLGIS